MAADFHPGSSTPTTRHSYMELQEAVLPGGSFHQQCDPARLDDNEDVSDPGQVEASCRREQAAATAADPATPAETAPRRKDFREESPREEDPSQEGPATK